MLFYNFAETGICESANVGKYAPICKLMYKDRTYNVSNAYVTFYQMGYNDVSPLKIKINSPATSLGEIHITKLNTSDLDAFLAVDNQDNQYATLYVKATFGGAKIIAVIESAVNGNAFTPIWGGKFTATNSIATYSPTKSVNMERPIMYKEVSGTTTSTGALSHGLNTSNFKILSCSYVGRVGVVFWRGDGYLTCFDNNIVNLANTSVTVGVFYTPI